MGDGDQLSFGENSVLVGDGFPLRCATTGVFVYIASFKQCILSTDSMIKICVTTTDSSFTFVVT